MNAGEQTQAEAPAPKRMPAVFISHGSPMVAIQKNGYTEALRRMGEDLPLPRAVVIVSAHWQAPSPIRVTGSERPPIIHDFSGFPAELYRLTYPSPGHPDLAGEIVAMLSAAGLEATLDTRRGLDHGAWIPMRLAYPAAGIPVIEVTLSRPRTPEDLLRLGRALNPLRSRGVLLIGSGGIVHNLMLVDFQNESAPAEAWARTFDAWVRAQLQGRNVEALSEYGHRAPHADLAVPTTEHFDPLFFVLGATSEGEPVRDLHEGIVHGNLSMRTFAIGR